MKPILTTVDPGLRAVGIAQFEGERLIRCGCVQCDYTDGPLQWVQMARAAAEWSPIRPDTLAIEYMVTRESKPGAHDNLIQLSQVSGGIYALMDADDARAVDPSWTRGRKKRVNHPRIRRRLSVDEGAALRAGLYGVPADNHKEVLDAIGIGLYILERL